MDFTCHLLRETRGVREWKNMNEGKVRQIRLDGNEDQTSEPPVQIKEEVPRLIKEYLYTAGSKILKCAIINLCIFEK